MSRFVHNSVAVSVAAGRALHSLDHTASFCLLGADLAATLGLFPAEAVGRAVRVGGVNHTIVGVLAPHTGGSVTPFDVNRIPCRDLATAAATHLAATGSMPGKGARLLRELAADPSVEVLWHGYNVLLRVV